MIDLLLAAVLAFLPVYEVTAYTATDHCPGRWCGGVTASGTKPEEGRTIACPRELSFGTMVYLAGVGRRVCEDRGGLVKGRVLDLFVVEREDAIRWGRRLVPVVVLLPKQEYAE